MLCYDFWADDARSTQAEAVADADADAEVVVVAVAVAEATVAYANTSVAKLKAVTVAAAATSAAADSAAAVGVHFLLCRNQALNYTTLHTRALNTLITHFTPFLQVATTSAYSNPSPPPSHPATGFIFIYKKGCDCDSVEIAKNQKQRRRQQHAETK